MSAGLLRPRFWPLLGATLIWCKMASLKYRPTLSCTSPSSLVPVIATRAQRIVVDVEFGAPTESAVPVRMRGFGMEGRFSRKPTQTVTDRAWAAITSGGT
jgi:hypothetical protein